MRTVDSLPKGFVWAVYTYNGVPEPGQFDPFCPDHGDPEYVASLEVVEETK